MNKFLRIFLLVCFTTLPFFSYGQRNKYKLYIKAGCKNCQIKEIRYNRVKVKDGYGASYVEYEEYFDTDPGATWRNVEIHPVGVGGMEYIFDFPGPPCTKKTGFIYRTGTDFDPLVIFELRPPALQTPSPSTTQNTFYGDQSIAFTTSGITDKYIWEITPMGWGSLSSITTTSSTVTLVANQFDYGRYRVRVKPNDDCSTDRVSDFSTEFYFVPFPAPTGNTIGLCENDRTTFTATLPGPLIWQLREGAGSWQYLTQTSGNTITIGLNDIYKSGSKFSTPRYIRYKKVGEADYWASDPSPSIVYYPSSPSLTDANVEITPASCTGRSDGKVVLKNVTGGTPTIYVTLKLADKDIVIGKASIPWDKSSFFTYDNIKDGNYILQLENSTVSCLTNYYLTVGSKPILQFTEIKKENPTCGGRSDGWINITVKDGLNPRYYTLYKKDSKGDWVQQAVPASTASSTYTFPTLSEGNYKVMAGDGCQIVSQEVMLQNPVFRMDTVSTTPAYCGLSYGKITVQMSGGKSPYTYSWKYGAQILSTTKATAENLLPGMYTVTGTDANGCSGPPLSVEVVEGIHPTLTVGSVPTGCGLAKGIGMVEIKQGFSPYTYSWKDKAGNTLRSITRKESSDTLAHLLKGTYQVVVQDSKGCQVQTKVEITEHAPLAITILSTTLASCPESSDGKAFIKVEGGLAPYIYEWNDAGKQTKAEAINLKSGNYTIKVTDALGCSKEQSIQVKSIPELTFSETIKPPTCYETCDASIHVAVSGGTPPYKYIWSTGVASNTIQSLCEGSYSLTVEDAKKCVKTVSYKIVKPSELLGVLKEKEATICSGQIMTLDAGEAKSYSWKNQQGNLIGQDRILKITQAGQYFLEVTNPYGCVIKDEFTLHTSTNLLEAKIIFANPQVVGDTVVLTEISWPKPDSWSWTYPSQLILHQKGPAPSQEQVILSEPGTYSIQFIAGLGECRDTVVRTITVLPKSESTTLLNQLSAVLGSKAITKLSLYPNPNSGKFTLEVILEKAAPVQIQLYGWQSTDPMFETTFEENTIHKQELDVLGVSKGLYVVVIYVPGEKPRLIKLMIE